MAQQRKTDSFKGMWHCTYWYPSNGKPGTEETSEYYCQAKQRGDKVVFESLANKPSHMVVNLTVDHSLATGNWTENTDPGGEFEGLEYSGATQLLVSADNAVLEGKWVGIGREKLADGSFEPQIYTGRFSLVKAGLTAAA